jgi:hypothetical protein
MDVVALAATTTHGTGEDSTDLFVAGLLCFLLIFVNV